MFFIFLWFEWRSRAIFGDYFFCPLKIQCRAQERIHYEVYTPKYVIFPVPSSAKITSQLYDCSSRKVPSETFEVERLKDNDSNNNKALPPTSETLPPGADLPRREWFMLNRAKAGRTGDNMLGWGKSASWAPSA